MKLKDPVLFFIVLLVVPVILFIVFEMSKLTNDEKLLKQIYDKQLESVLFSVNQFTNDVVDSWANETEQAVRETGPRVN
ncbi:MAG: hypothetical protein HC896_16090 [Bacteroidales bacterium]|nr:hypothetical protein [Bacteroidales bacterium]